MPANLKDVPFFHDLPPAELKAVEKYLVEKSFKKGEIIHYEGTLCTTLFFVKSGRVKVYRLSAAGKEQIYEVLDAGGTCACNPGEGAWQCTSSAEALTDSTLWFLSRENYARMIRDNAQMLRSLTALFAQRLKCFSDIIEDVTLKSAKDRLVKFLLDLLEQKKGLAAGNDTLFIRMTREEIAHRLGLTRETVARQISALKRKKLIDLHPYQIVILDRQGLRNMLG